MPGRFRVPEIVKHVANKLGLTPMNVLNQARAAMDMPPLVPPPSLEYVDSQLSPVARALLYQYPTANRSIRGLVSSEFNPAVVPGGYGDKIKRQLIHTASQLRSLLVCWNRKVDIVLT